MNSVLNNCCGRCTREQHLLETLEDHWTKMVILTIMSKAETLKERNRSSMAHSKTRLVKLRSPKLSVEQSLGFHDHVSYYPRLDRARSVESFLNYEVSEMFFDDIVTNVVVREGLFSVSLERVAGLERASLKRDSLSSLLSASPSVSSINLVWPNARM